MVELTTTEGDVGIYAEHIPMTAIVAPGILTITESKDSVKKLLCWKDLLRSCRIRSRSWPNHASGRMRSMRSGPRRPESVQSDDCSMPMTGSI